MFIGLKILHLFKVLNLTPLSVLSTSTPMLNFCSVSILGKLATANLYQFLLAFFFWRACPVVALALPEATKKVTVHNCLWHFILACLGYWTCLLVVKGKALVTLLAKQFSHLPLTTIAPIGGVAFSLSPGGPSQKWCVGP